MGFFNSPVAFGFVLTCFLVFQVSVGVYIAGALTTLEKQYRLTSSVSGIIISISDFASLASIIFVTYLGQHSHRPRIIGLLGLITGLGGILSGVPHFLYPAYREGDIFTGAAQGNSSETDPVFVCDATRDNATCTAAEIDSSGSRIEEMWALLLGQALMGISYGPLFPLAITYLDDQVRGTTTPYYIGVFLSAGTTAPLVGFAQGFGFLQMFVNWPEKFDGMREWIGAWWMGFILDGIIILFISIPFFFFPKEMDLDIDESDVPEEKRKKEGRRQVAGVGVKDFMTSGKRIFTNFVWVMITLATVVELAVSACFGFFMPKFIEIQYNIPPTLSALLVGILIMPAALIGNLSSGIVVKRLKLGSLGCGRLLVFLAAIGSIFMPIVYFLSCPQTIYAGLTESGLIDVTSDCNQDCECSKGRYEPVCGYNNLTYSTACFAGCNGSVSRPTDDPMVNKTVYTGCGCSTGGGDDNVEAQEASQGECLDPCNMLYYAGIVLFVNVFFGSFSKNPLLIVQMRCVADSDKTFALGLASLIGRAAGFLPAPLYMGAAIQGTCILDRIECGVTGDCLVYNSQQFRLMFLSVLTALSVTSLLCYILALIKATANENKLDREKRDGELIKNGLGDVKQIEGAENKGYDMEVGTQTNLTSF